MPGLSIVYDQKNIYSKQDIKSLSESMAAVMTHFDSYILDNVVYEKAAFCCVSLGSLDEEPTSLIDDNGSLVVMLNGELYNTTPIRNDLIKLGYKFRTRSNIELILHLFKAKGIDFVRDLNGSFIILIYDKTRHRLLICNDRYGSRPIYWCRSNSLLLLSSEVKSILAEKRIKRKIDISGLVDLMAAGYLLHNKTLIEGIKLLPSATMMVAEGERLDFHQYWSWYDIPQQKLSYGEAIQKMGQLWIQAVQRSTEDQQRIGVTLSGGLDSRAILAAADHLGLQIPAWTFGKKECWDIQIAAQVCEALDIEHHISFLSAADFEENIDQIVWLTDGHLNVVHGHSLRNIHSMSNHVDVRLHAFALDLLAGGSYLLPGNRLFTSFEEFQKYLLDWYSRKDRIALQSLPELFAQKYASHALGLFNDSIAQSVQDFVVDQNQTDYSGLHNRVRRCTNNGSIMTSSLLVDRKPSLDNDFIDFIYGLPLEWRLHTHVYSDMLLSFFPSLFQTIPWQKTGISIGLPRRVQKLNYHLAKGKNAVNAGIRFVGLPPIFNRNKDFADYNYWMRNDPALRQYIIKTLLSDRALGRGYFEPTFVKSIIESHMHSKGNQASLIGVLLTFEIFCKQFIDGETPVLSFYGNE